MPIAAVYKKGVIKPMKKLDLKENEEIEIEIKRKKSVVDELTGIIKIDPKTAKEIIEMEIWDYDPEFEELLKLKNKR